MKVKVLNNIGGYAETETPFNIGQKITFAHDKPKTGTQKDDFEIIDIFLNKLINPSENMILLKPLGDFFKKDYPQLNEFYVFEDVLIRRLKNNIKT